HKSKDDIKVVTNPLDQAHGYFVMKWTNLNDNGEAVGSAATNGVSTDMPIFRLAEAYLNLAEAVARGGNGATKAEAAKLINKLRTRAGVSSINESNITTDYLFGERTREMYWELTRRTDLVRYDRFTSGSYLWDLKQSAIDSKYNYFPIPQSELTANPNLSNPEY
ncbi:MAG: RagB/SusD family nutrient uptake outer membrane protein, partial [Bacteroidales bacterium]|nr:RagB/SusD family nutrient uptake outer membrane protein [Bacteroidales bacterium]